MNTTRSISAVLLAGAVAAGAAWWLQREITGALRSQIELLRDEQRTLNRLHAEHERLLATQVPATELARLQSDHAALRRLRGEIEQLQARAKQSSTDADSP